MQHSAYPTPLLAESFNLIKNSLWPITGAAYFIGALWGRNSTLSIVVGTIYFAFIYNGLIYALDKTNEVSSRLKNTIYPLLAILNMAFVTYLLAVSTSPGRLWLLATLLVAICYNFSWFKFSNIPILDSISFGWLIVAPYLFGVLLSSNDTVAWPGVMALIFWAIASHIFGAAGDELYDRARNITTIATLLGKNLCLKLSLSFYIFAIVIISASYGTVGLLCSVVLILYALNVARFIKIGSDSKSLMATVGWKSYVGLNYLAVTILGLIVLVSSKMPYLTGQMFWLETVIGLAVLTIYVIFGYKHTQRLFGFDYIEHSQLVIQQRDWGRLIQAVHLDAASSYLKLGCEFSLVVTILIVGFIAVIGPYIVAYLLIDNGQSALASLIALIIAVSTIVYTSYLRSNKKTWLGLILLYPLSFFYQLVVILVGATMPIMNSVQTDH